MNEVIFDADKAKQFRQAYVEAVSHDREVFVFEGAEFLTQYAQYVLVALEHKFHG